VRNLCFHDLHGRIFCFHNLHERNLCSYLCCLAEALSLLFPLLCGFVPSLLG
jgi:hypothetical protein